jgi:hypothetical protein
MILLSKRLNQAQTTVLMQMTVGRPRQPDLVLSVNLPVNNNSLQIFLSLYLKCTLLLFTGLLYLRHICLP